jgi:EAL domain-containing protein (putative c-di-GMP-specific phosphodiesterase class I)
MVGVEALVRWQPPGKALVPPMRFIPLAEETGLILLLGEWVLRTACAQAKAWLDAGGPPLLMAVNLSARQFQQPDLIDRIRAALQDTGLPSTCLELEITESTLMEQGQQAASTLAALKELGVRLAIDDFGTGYSSLAYLKRFPIDKLKIDQSFVRDIPHDPNDMEIAAAIISLARNLRLEALAEGVETEEQLTFLQKRGCDTCQGYLFSRPLPASELEVWLRN